MRKSSIWWAVVRKDGRDPMPCIAGRTRRAARELRDVDERVIKVRVVEVKRRGEA